jgi:hypothetical protein
VQPKHLIQYGQKNLPSVPSIFAHLAINIKGGQDMLASLGFVVSTGMQPAKT